MSFGVDPFGSVAFGMELDPSMPLFQATSLIRGRQIKAGTITADRLVLTDLAGSGLTTAGNTLAVRKRRETPSGNVNGQNVLFALSQFPSEDSLLLFRNGILLTPDTDYTTSGTRITMDSAPIDGDTLTAWYLY